MKWEGSFPPVPQDIKRFDQDWLRERRRLHMEIEAPGWAGPIYWLESLPRTRWWAWFREKGDKMRKIFIVLGILALIWFFVFLYQVFQMITAMK